MDQLHENSTDFYAFFIIDLHFLHISDLKKSFTSIQFISGHKRSSPQKNIHTYIAQDFPPSYYLKFITGMTSEWEQIVVHLQSSYNYAQLCWYIYLYFIIITWNSDLTGVQLYKYLK